MQGNQSVLQLAGGHFLHKVADLTLKLIYVDQNRVEGGAKCPVYLEVPGKGEHRDQKTLK